MNKKPVLVLCLLSALLAFLLTFSLAFSVLHCIHSFIEIEQELLLLGPVVLGILGAFVEAFHAFICRAKTNKSRFKLWIENNYPKLLLSYFVLLYLLISVTNSIVWTADEINDVMAIEWTIFGLSLTVFLVWNILIVEYLKKKQPVSKAAMNLREEYKLLVEKRYFSREIETTFSTIVLLSINLFLLLISSSLVYLSHLPEAIVTQNIVRCSFCFSANTLALLFFDMLKPLKKDKESLLKANRVTEKELDAAELGAIIQAIIEMEIKGIIDSEGLTDEEKKQRIVLCKEEWEKVISDLKAKKSAASASASDTNTSDTMKSSH